MPKPRNPSAPRSRYGNRRAPGAAQPTATVTLPNESPLDPPPMPAGVEWTESQRARWESLWKSPQAFMWDETAAGTVALLITYETALLTGKASAWQAQEYRYASDSLGLTPTAMQKLGWKIEGTDK
ncbi:phage terminase small subunit [Streptomyces sp. KR55]|uniref:phage terminase small subunit n=1 Tax=Streptomyces sp. KR55 TaxID=3457425 RepID=UPI003FCF1FD1